MRRSGAVFRRRPRLGSSNHEAQNPFERRFAVIVLRSGLLRRRRRRVLVLGGHAPPCRALMDRIALQSTDRLGVHDEPWVVQKTASTRRRLRIWLIVIIAPAV